MRKNLFYAVIFVGLLFLSGCGDSGDTVESNTGPGTASGILDTTFGGDGIVVHDGVAGGTGVDLGDDIAVDGTGNVFVTGYSLNSAGNNDMVILKYTSSGVLDGTFGTGGIVVHDNAAGGSGADGGTAIALDGTGNVYVVGYSTGTSANDMVIWKYTSSGVLDTTFGTGGIVVDEGAAGGNSNDYGSDIALDSAGNVFVAGYSLGVSTYDMVVWKYTSDGVLDGSFGTGGIVVQDNVAGGSNWEWGRGIALDGTGNVFVTGSSLNSDGNDDMFVCKYTSSGVLDGSFGTGGIVVHHNAAGGNTYDFGYALATDATGNVFVAGYSSGVSNYDMVIWKYTGGGVLDTTFGTGGIVVQDNAAGGNGNDYGYDLALDGTGDVFVAGYSAGVGGRSDAVILKYTSGGVLDGSFGTGGIVVLGAAGGSGSDTGFGLTLNGTSNAFVVGSSIISGSSYMAVWKLIR